MKTAFSFGIARRLYAVCLLVTVALAALGTFAFYQLNMAARLASNTEDMRVPQLKAMMELELNVTQVSLQLRHAILSTSPRFQ